MFPLSKLLRARRDRPRKLASSYRLEMPCIIQTTFDTAKRLEYVAPFPVGRGNFETLSIVRAIIIERSLGD